MSNLEAKLRELQRQHGGRVNFPHWDALVAAARIGAELEREACADVAVTYQIDAIGSNAEAIAWRANQAMRDAIRARGGK